MVLLIVLFAAAACGIAIASVIDGEPNWWMFGVSAALLALAWFLDERRKPRP